jgi:hypothetical protein
VWCTNRSNLNAVCVIEKSLSHQILEQRIHTLLAATGVAARCISGNTGDADKRFVFWNT